MTDWLRLIRAEYREMPNLNLTKPQVQRLWSLDARTCEALLQALEASRFLRRTCTGTYVTTGASVEETETGEYPRDHDASTKA